MSTYAHYIIWVGIAVNHVNETIISSEFEGFLDSFEEEGTKHSVERYSLQEISMHGDSVGYGIVIKDLEWVTSEETPEALDLAFMRRIPDYVEGVKRIFNAEGMDDDIPVDIYHHVDLGG